MKIQSFKYKLIAVPDAPEPHGIGLDSPDGQYWVTGEEVYFRPHLPRDEEGPIEGWALIEAPELSAFGRFLEALDFGCPHEVYIPLPGRELVSKIIVNCDEVGCSIAPPHTRSPIT